MPDRKPLRLVPFAGRSLAAVAAWATCLAVGVGGFLAGASPRPDEVIAFGAHLGLASLVAAVVALAVGGRARRAPEASMVFGGVGLIAAGGLFLLLWVVQPQVRAWTGLGQNHHLTIQRALWVGFLFATTSETAILATLATAAGVVAGLLIRLGRGRPRLAGGLAASLLIGIGASAGSAAGRIADHVLYVRSGYGRWPTSSIQDVELASALGGVAGSIVGVVLACAAIRSGPGQASAGPSSRATIERP